MDILRFITAGNVDDGKSTLIGRLLYDSKNLKDDILLSIESLTDKNNINLAHITDGLRSERAMGITIDVAYKYFTTHNRKYIITDAPGHVQYTRNLVTGASGVDVMIILIDAKNGITEQTRRHSLVASFLNIKNILVAVNKMDLLKYDEIIFRNIREAYEDIAIKLRLKNFTYIPISALEGDNVFLPSNKMKWYTGPTLIQYLENSEPIQLQSIKPKFVIQYCSESTNEMTYLGKITSGSFSVNQTVALNNGSQNIVIRKMIHGYDDVESAVAGDNISIVAEKTPVAKRGDIFAEMDTAVTLKREFGATVFWLCDTKTLDTGEKYILRVNSTDIECLIKKINYKIDINSLQKQHKSENIEINDLASVTIATKENFSLSTFKHSPENGRGILICPKTFNTLAALTITS